MLLNCFGAEGAHTFYTFPLADKKWATALMVLKHFFMPKVNVVAEQ